MPEDRPRRQDLRNAGVMRSLKKWLEKAAQREERKAMGETFAQQWDSIG